jgi:hypothetical protein
MGLQESFDLYQTATDTVLRNPREALPIARAALHGFRWRCRCMRVRTGCLVGQILSMQGRRERSERIYRILYELSDGCACCQPVIDRHFSLLLSSQEKHPEAIARAERALAATVTDRLLFVSTLGHACYYGKDPRAASLLAECLQAPAESPTHRLALYNLAAALIFSDDRDRNLEEVERLLPEIRESYKDVRGVTTERGYLKWLDGGVSAARSDTLKGWARKTALCSARENFKTGYKIFYRLDLPEANVIWLDFLAVLVKIDPEKIKKNLKGLNPPEGFNLAEITGEHSRDKLLPMLCTLRECFEGVPLVSYA